MQQQYLGDDPFYRTLLPVVCLQNYRERELQLVCPTDRDLCALWEICAICALIQNESPK